MDLDEEDGSCDGNVDEENDVDEVLGYEKGEALEAKQSSSVNSSLQWPLRHNNHNENLDRHTSYSCNGFRQATKLKYTYTGRISRIPSRYLDTDSDSCDGSLKNDGRLKVKRRRSRRKMPSNSTKMHVNGFEEHKDATLLHVADFEVGKLNESKEKCFEYPDVFQNASPISSDIISHFAHDIQQDTRAFHTNTALSNEMMCLKTSETGSLLESNNFSRSKQNCCFACCVDERNANNGSTLSESLTKSECTQTRQEKEPNDAQSFENYLNMPCKRKRLVHEGDINSLTKRPVVNSEEISKQVSCAIDNERTGTRNEDCSLKSSCISTENSRDFENNESTPIEKKSVGKFGSKLSRKRRFVKAARKRTSKTFAAKDEKFETSTLSSKAQELDYLKGIRMKKALAKKLQVRRNEGLNKNDVLKRSGKNGLVSKLKQEPVRKVNVSKLEKLSKRTGRRKLNKMKGAETSRSSQHSQELNRVLGMRRSPSGDYEFLVEWRNGTSCWVSSDEIVTDKHNCYLREFLAEAEQDISVLNRVPFQAYCCNSLSLKESRPISKSEGTIRNLFCVENLPEPSHFVLREKKEVTVEYEDDNCYIKLKRETCKRKKTCLKIMTDLITALEDAATSKCEIVILQGLSSGVLCGLKLDDMSSPGADERENVILSQGRYLVQTLTNYPKLLVALISKSAEGIGAAILSLFDMICDEETWNTRQFFDTCENETKKLYTLPRLTCHSLLSEDLLMGRGVEALKSPCPPSPAYDACFTGDSIVANTLVEIETTLRLLRKETSLLNSKLFPSIEPSFALFSDIKTTFDEHLNSDKTNDGELASDHHTSENNTSASKNPALSSTEENKVEPTIAIEQTVKDCEGTEKTAMDAVTDGLIKTEKCSADQGAGRERNKDDEGLNQSRMVVVESDLTRTENAEATGESAEGRSVEAARDTEQSTLDAIANDLIRAEQSKGTDRRTVEPSVKDPGSTDQCALDVLGGDLFRTESPCSDQNAVKKLKKSLEETEHIATDVVANNLVNVENSSIDKSAMDSSFKEGEGTDQSGMEVVVSDLSNIEDSSIDQSSADTLCVNTTDYGMIDQSDVDDGSTMDVVKPHQSALVNVNISQNVSQTTTVSLTLFQCACDKTISDQSTPTENSDQDTMQDHTCECSTVDHTSTFCSAADQSFREQSAVDNPASDQKSSDQTSSEHCTFSYTTSGERIFDHFPSDQSTGDTPTSDQSTVDHPTSDQKSSNETISLPSTIDYATSDQSLLDHYANNQSTSDYPTSDQTISDQANIHDLSTVVPTISNCTTVYPSTSELSASDLPSNYQNTTDRSMSDHNTVDGTISNCSTVYCSTSDLNPTSSEQCAATHKSNVQTIVENPITDETSTTVTSIDEKGIDDAIVQRNAVLEENTDREMSDLISASTATNTKIKANNITDEVINNDAREQTSKETRIITDTNVNQSMNCEDSNNHETTYCRSITVNHENSFNQFSPDHIVADNTSKDCPISDASCRRIEEDEDSLARNIDESTCGNVETKGTETAKHITRSKSEYDGQCTCDNSTSDNGAPNDSTAGNTTASKRDTTSLEVTNELLEDNASKHKSTRYQDEFIRNENCANVRSNCDNLLLTQQYEPVSKQTDCNSCCPEDTGHNTTSNTQIFEEEKLNEKSDLLTRSHSDASSNTTQNTADIIGKHITNSPNITDSHTTEHKLENARNATTQSIRVNPAEQASIELVSPNTAAVDRYLKELEAQIEAEKNQAEKYIKEISRLWDNPFVSKTK